MKLKLLLAASLAGLIILLLQIEPAGSPASKPAGEAEPSSAMPNEFVISGAKVFDGERWLGARQVWVRDGLIVAVEQQLDAPAELPRIDGQGRALLPGLIDAHVHSWGQAREQMLRFGVSTGLDMFSAPTTLAEQRQQRAALAATERADLWSAGSLITAAGGHGTQFGMAIDTLERAEDATAMVKRRVEAGSDYIKIVYDNGHAYGRNDLPSLDRPRLQAAIKAAHAVGLKAVVHVSDLAAASEAIALGADGLVHVFHDQVLDRQRDGAMLERLAKDSGFVIATLSVIDGLSSSAASEAIASDPNLSPLLDGEQKQSLARRFPASMQDEQHLQTAMANVRALHEAGIDVLAGSDAPNPGTAHGASLHGELALLVAAGLSPTEALAAATSLPAKHFGLGDRGRIAAGLRADLLLVEGDPEQHIEDSRRIVRLWKNGREVQRRPPSKDVAERKAPARLEFDCQVADDWQSGAAGSRWLASSDQMMGGQSTASIQHQEAGGNGEPGALQLRGTIVAGAPYPFASAMLMLHPSPMQAVDAGHWQRLSFRARGSQREFGLLVFSGGGQPSTPFRLGFAVGADWQDYAFDLSALSAIDRSQLRAIGLAAGLPQGEFELQIDRLVLE